MRAFVCLGAFNLLSLYGVFQAQSRFGKFDVLCTVAEDVVKFYLGHSHIWGEFEIQKRFKPLTVPNEVCGLISSFVGDEKWTLAIPDLNSGSFDINLKGFVIEL